MSTSGDRIRVVSVDDTATWRTVVSKLVREDDALEMVGTAVDGQAGVELIEKVKPDVVTLDVEMPRLSGHEVLQELRTRGIRPRVIMLSSLTDRGANATLKALALGAVDFVCKPTGRNSADSTNILRDELIPKIKAVAPRTTAATLKAIDVSAARRIASGGTAPATPSAPAGTDRPARPSARTSARPSTAPAAKTPGKTPGKTTGGILGRVPATAPDAIVIGVSTGGPAALARVIPKLPGDLPRPVLMVQHMPPKFTRTLAKDLDRRSEVEVVEGEAGMEIIPGRVIIAPGGHHMTVTRSGEPVVAIDDDPPVEACRPAVEKLFLSAAERWKNKILAVMLTGMGHDGQAGCTRIHELGGKIICQSPESCVVFGMPRLPVERGQAEIADLEDIAGEIVRRTGGSPVRKIAA